MAGAWGCFCVEFGFFTGAQASSHRPKTYIWASGELVTLNWPSVQPRAWLIVCLVCYPCHELASCPGCTLPPWFNFRVDWKALQPDCFLMPLSGDWQLIGFQLGFAFLSLFFRSSQKNTNWYRWHWWRWSITSSKENPLKSTTSPVAQQNRKTGCIFFFLVFQFIYLFIFMSICEMRWFT